MTSKKQLLLITSDPHSHKAKMAFAHAKAALDQGWPIRVFFYGNGAHTANRLMWQTADQPSLRDDWAALAKSHQLPLPVCVSTALARGVSDIENAKRHRLDGDNLHPAFALVGLSELALLIDDDTQVLQF